MKEFVIVTLVAAAVFPVWIVMMSFVMMENGFRTFSTGYIVRMTIVLVVISWAFLAISAGGAA
ncbi:hypothetical protein PYX08_20130 [Citrobacter freundii]|nr:hypothetical protein [Citrobacter freundii]